MNKFNFKKYDLQLFAEPGEGGSSEEQTPPKQKYSDEEYEKLKAMFDKEVSEKASLKKQLKDKQTEEEKKQTEEAEKKAQVEQMQKELSTLKIERKLASDFDEEEIKELGGLITSGDTDKLVDALVKIRQAYKKKVLEEAKAEFSKSADLPGGGGNDDTPSFVQNYIDKRKPNENKKSAKDYYFKR